MREVKVYWRAYQDKAIGWIPEYKRFVLSSKYLARTSCLSRESIDSTSGVTEIYISSPVNICWSLVNYCNLNCAYCLDNKGTNEINSKKRRSILQKIIDSGVFSVDFSGGEPLILNDVFELMFLAKQSGIHVTITTNGVYLNPTRINILSESVDLVTISLDGAKPETHDRLRNHIGLFDKCIEAINSMSKKFIPVRVNMTVIPHNLLEIGELAGLCKQLGVQELSLRQFLPIGHGANSAAEYFIPTKIFTDVVTKIKMAYESNSFKVSMKSIRDHQGHIVVRSSGDVYLKKIFGENDDSVENICLGNLVINDPATVFSHLPEESKKNWAGILKGTN
ncbi:MAG: radical SAM protein [Caldilinea sp. CFX5]|nr:radical SAM protein [Caldilinea sp. CFX5]